MKRIRFPIYFTTGFLIVYATTALFEVNVMLTVTMFIISPFLVIWMVYSVLKKGKYNGPTFNEKFYEDHNYTRLPDNDRA